MGKDKNDKSHEHNLEKNSSQDEKYSKDASQMEQAAIEIKKRLKKNLK